jgi:two-component system, NarL family, response regulator NreC
MYGQGLSTGRIADVLCISPKTVEKHCTSIMNKLDIHDRFESLKYTIKIKVVDPELWAD